MTVSLTKLLVFDAGFQHFQGDGGTIQTGLLNLFILIGRGTLGTGGETNPRLGILQINFLVSGYFLWPKEMI